MRLNIGIASAVLTAFISFSVAAQMGPAPSGTPATVAARIIANADHPCPKVLDAFRMDDGSVRATCSNGETYRIATLNGTEFALRCSAASKMGVKGC